MEESLPQSFQGHPSPQARAIEVLLSPQSAKTPTVLPSAAVAAVAAVAESLEKEGSTYSQLGAEGSVPPTGSSAAGSEGVPPVATAVHDVLGKIEEGSVSDGANSDNVSLGGGEAGGGEERVGKTTVATEVGVEGEMQLDEERAEGGIREEESGGAGSAPTVSTQKTISGGLWELLTFFLERGGGGVGSKFVDKPCAINNATLTACPRMLAFFTSTCTIARCWIPVHPSFEL